MPTTSLPENPSLEHLNGQAKLVRDLIRAGDPGGLAMVDEFHPRLDSAHLDDDRRAGFKTADAQPIVARMYRFPNWNRVREHVAVVAGHSFTPHAERTSSPDQPAPFTTDACLDYAEDGPSPTDRVDPTTGHPCCTRPTPESPPTTPTSQPSQPSRFCSIAGRIPTPGSSGAASPHPSPPSPEPSEAAKATSNGTPNASRSPASSSSTGSAPNKTAPGTNQADELRQLLNKRPELLPQLRSEHPGLCKNVTAEHEKMLDLLIELGFDINDRTGTKTALHDAAEANDTSRSRLLIDHGADPNLTPAEPIAFASPDHQHEYNFYPNAAVTIDTARAAAQVFFLRPSERPAAVTWMPEGNPEHNEN